MDKIITKKDINKYNFEEYKKVKNTKISIEVLPVGSKVETLEGNYTCQVPSRLAIDEDGNVYPIAETIFDKSYELAD